MNNTYYSNMKRVGFWIGAFSPLIACGVVGLILISGAEAIEDTRLTPQQNILYNHMLQKLQNQSKITFDCTLDQSNKSEIICNERL